MQAVLIEDHEAQEEQVVRVAQAARALTIPAAEIQLALSGNIDALENILFTNRELDQATCQFIHDQATFVAAGTEKSAIKAHLLGNQGRISIQSYQCALTLLGHIKMQATLGAENGYNPAAGFACLEKAAKADSPWGLYLVGSCYRTGQGCAIDRFKSQGYYIRALRRLPGKQRIENELLTLLSNGGNLQPFRDYLEHMVFSQNPAQLKELHGKAMRKHFVCLTASADDPMLSEELKFNYCSALCPLESIVEYEQGEEFIFSWGMLYAELANRSLARQDKKKYEEARSLATQCFERLNKMNPQHNHVPVLRNKLRSISYSAIEHMTDFNDPQKGAAGLRALLGIATDPAGLFLLAKLVMRYDTDDIFINRNDKFRFILHCLGQIDIQDRDHCEGYERLLRETIANLHLQPNAVPSEDTLIVKFDTIASVIAGCPMRFPSNNGRLRYIQGMDAAMVMDSKTVVDGTEVSIDSTPNREKLVAHFGTSDVRSVESLLCDSYSDNVGELDIAYLLSLLSAKFKARIEKAAISPEEVEIGHGNHGLTIAQEKERQQRELQTAQTPHALALRAIEKAVPDYEAAKKKHDYRLMAWLKSTNDAKRCDSANQFFKACKLLNNEDDLMEAIVRQITQEQGRFESDSLKTFLLRYLAEAFNLGNIKDLEIDPALSPYLVEAFKNGNIHELKPNTALFSGIFCNMIRPSNLMRPIVSEMGGMALDFAPAQGQPVADPLLVKAATSLVVKDDEGLGADVNDNNSVNNGIKL